MSLWLCIRLPLLPLESLVIHHAPEAADGNAVDDEQAIIVLERQRVVACNNPAGSAGVEIGHSGQTASALLDPQTPRLLERDIAAEKRTLVQLQSWAYGVTPTLEIWRTDCLQLEIGGCLKLHQGLDALMQRVRQDLKRRGYTTVLGLASNRHAAWLLSYSSSNSAADLGLPLKERLRALPPYLIGTDWDPTFKRALDNVQKAGIRSLGELMAMPPSAIGKRCGKRFMEWLTTAARERDDAHQDYLPPPQFLDLSLIHI